MGTMKLVGLTGLSELPELPGFTHLKQPFVDSPWFSLGLLLLMTAVTLLSQQWETFNHVIWFLYLLLAFMLIRKNNTDVLSPMAMVTSASINLAGYVSHEPPFQRWVGLGIAAWVIVLRNEWRALPPISPIYGTRDSLLTPTSQHLQPLSNRLLHLSRVVSTNSFTFLSTFILLVACMLFMRNQSVMDIGIGMLAILLSGSTLLRHASSMPWLMLQRYVSSERIRITSGYEYDTKLARLRRIYFTDRHMLSTQDAKLVYCHLSPHHSNASDALLGMLETIAKNTSSPSSILPTDALMAVSAFLNVSHDANRSPQPFHDLHDHGLGWVCKDKQEQTWFLGTATFMLEQNISIVRMADQTAPLESLGAQVLYLCTQSKTVACIAFDPLPSPYAKSFFSLLHKTEIEPVLLTAFGDEYAAAIAQQHGIERRLSDLTPSQQCEEIHQYPHWSAVIGPESEEQLSYADVPLVMGSTQHTPSVSTPGTNPYPLGLLIWLTKKTEEASLRYLVVAMGCWLTVLGLVILRLSDPGVLTAITMFFEIYFIFHSQSWMKQFALLKQPLTQP